jgi:methionyl-tRNA formyltransferase
MGTPDFAVPSLKILVENGYDIVGVVTMPDKPGGRLGLIESPIKKYALSKGLKVLQPPKLKNPEFLDELCALQAELQVVVAFRMLPEVVWNMPKHGTINLHGSLLPKFRGAAPINWAIISGAKETGLTTFRLTHEIDTGDVFFREKIAILDDDTAGTLHDKMMPIGAALVLRTVQAVEHNSHKLLPQSNAKATLAPKIFTNDAIIDFNKSVRKVYDFIRGMSPYPGAFTIMDECIFKILALRMEEVKPSHPIGTFVSDGKTYLRIACKGGYILADEVQMEGKRRMNVKDFLNGYQREWVTA